MSILWAINQSPTIRAGWLGGPLLRAGSVPRSEEFIPEERVLPPGSEHSAGSRTLNSKVHDVSS